MSMGAMQGRASAGDAGAAKVRGVATGCPSGGETDGHRLTRARDGKAEHVGHIQGAPQVGCWKNEECLQQSVLFSQGKTWSSASEGWEGVLDV